MSHRDDDEMPEASSSSADYFKADKGRREQLQREIEEEKGKQVDTGKTELRAGVELQKLKHEVTGEEESDAAAAQVRDERKKEEQTPETFGTKTLTQEEEQTTVTAQEKLTPESVIERTKEKDDRDKQAGQEFQQQAG